MNGIQEIASLVIVIATAITAILTIIEKCKAIKWKPLTNLFKNQEVVDKLDNMAIRQNDFMVKLNSIENENDMREIKRLRAYILNYANEKCEQGIKMTQEQETYFDECCVDYEKLIEKYGLVNGHTIQSIKLVSDYRKMELKDKYKKNVKVDK